MMWPLALSYSKPIAKTCSSDGRNFAVLGNQFITDDLLTALIFTKDRLATEWKFMIFKKYLFFFFNPFYSTDRCDEYILTVYYYAKTSKHQQNACHDLLADKW